VGYNQTSIEIIPRQRKLTFVGIQSTRNRETNKDTFGERKYKLILTNIGRVLPWTSISYGP
jgi:hypothetical protein